MSDISWDDPEMYPEDDDESPHPGDPAVEGTEAYYPVVTEEETVTKRLNPERRARRLQEIDNMLATQAYHKGRKEELRWERGGRYS